LVLNPPLGGLLKTHVALWPLLALVLIPPPSWWLTRNPRGLFDPFGIGLDPPFWKVYWTPKWPFWPLFFGFIILPVIQFTGLYLI
jgi:hypothetical protein